MRKVIVSVVLAVLAVALLSGCMSTFASASGKLAYAEIEGESKGEIMLEEGFMYLIHPDVYMLGEKEWENIDAKLDPELSRLGADAVRDLKLSYGATLIDTLLSSVVPVLGWGTYIIEGEAVSR